LNRLTWAWLALGVIGAGLLALVAFIMTLFLKTMVDGWIIGGFAFFGFLPGLFGACGQRFAGLAGFAGLFGGLIWGLVEGITKKGHIWPVFVYLDILLAFFVCMSIGLLVQMFIKPKPVSSKRPTKQIKPVAVAKRPVRYSNSKNQRINQVEDSKLYEV
jgi:hypothetical protein